MINFLIDNDVKSGVLNIKDNSTELSGVTKGIIKINKLGFEQSLTSSSTPTLNDFLNPSLNSFIPITARVDEVVDIEYILLKPLTGITFSANNNIVSKSGISAETVDILYLYSDSGKLYSIDKDASQLNLLYLTETIQSGTVTLYAAYYSKKCQEILYDIPKFVKHLTLTKADCACKNCGSTIKDITAAHRYIEGLAMTTENDCDSKESFMRCLKELFNLC
jgi:hypothetical protein